jgi:hypothetical protein
MEVLVFKTNVQKKSQAVKIIKMLMGQLPKHNINFDLEDCDKILRVEGNNIQETKIIEQVLAQGFDAIPL